MVCTCLTHTHTHTHPHTLKELSGNEESAFRWGAEESKACGFVLLALLQSFEHQSLVRRM